MCCLVQFDNTLLQPQVAVLPNSTNIEVRTAWSFENSEHKNTFRSSANVNNWVPVNQEILQDLTGEILNPSMPAVFSIFSLEVYFSKANVAVWYFIILHCYYQ